MHHDRIQKPLLAEPRGSPYLWAKATTLATLVLASTACPLAQASVKICNHSNVPLDVAFAHGGKDAPGVSTGGDLGVTAEGWWVLAPNECATVGGMDAREHWLYYHSKNKGGNSGGSSMLCVANKPFTLAQQFKRNGDRCPAGQHTVGFKRFDADKKNWTLNLT